MSELTPCNYCTLKRIRARAKKEGKVITLVKEKDTKTFPGWIKVHVHLKGKGIGKSCASFAAISDHCVC